VLTHPMLDQLAQLGLTGMVQAFAELEASGDGVTLTHADWLGLLVDREMTHRRDKRLAARLRYARLRHHAVVEDIDYRAPRGLDRGLFNKLVNGEWIDAHDNLILCGPTGVGKSWLACALGHKALYGASDVKVARADLLIPFSEPRGACHWERSLALRPCIRLDPREVRTMKHSFASRARLRAGGPILPTAL